MNEFRTIDFEKQIEICIKFKKDSDKSGAISIIITRLPNRISAYTFLGLGSKKLMT